MSINTAIMFTVAGACLLTYGRTAPGWAAGRAAGGWLLIVLSLTILSEHLFGIDLPLDLAHVHEALGDGHAKPGRTAPNACLAFLLAGIVLLGSPAAARRWRSWLLAGALLVLLIGLAGFIGYLLRLDAMYQIASFNRMATFTALGVTVLGLGLWSVHGGAGEGRAAQVEDEAQRITKLAAGLLVAFAIATGLLSFSVLRESYELAAADYHQDTAASLALSIGSHYKETALLSTALAQRPSVVRAMVALASGATGPAADEELRQRVAIFATMGFRAVAIRMADGREVYRHGAFGPSVAPVPMTATPAQASHVLQWNRGYMVRSSHPIIHEGRLVATIRTERALPILDQIIAQALRATESTDVVLCARVSDASRCFPSRFYASSTGWPLNKHGKPALPISRALLGEHGAAHLKDPRGRQVLAGFAPLPNHGMGVVVKTEVRELYLPLRQQMHVLLGGMAAFVVFGVLLLRRWLQPVITQIIAERQRIKAILDNANDAFIGINPDGTVSDWNKQAEQTLGIRAADAIGQDLAQLIIPEPMRHRHQQGLALFRASGKGPVINTRVDVDAIHAHGHLVPVELSVTAFPMGLSFGASAFLRDLTEEKLGERRAAEHALALEEARLALAQSQKLEAVGKLTGGIAHDFNNVLQVVGASLELLIHEGIEDARVLGRIDMAMGAVDRGARLASHLLAFARKQPLQPRAINLERVVRDMADLLQRSIGDEIDVEMISAAGLWNTLTDPHQLEQVVLNLAINARDAMDGRGHLTIELANSVLDELYTAQVPDLAPGQFVMLAVSDTGGGMSPETLERAFEPFFSTKPEGQGTGLGLSMAYGFVKQSHGHIKIYSEVGHGTTVRIYLPRSHAAEERLIPAASRVVEGGTEAILVVEDDPAVQKTAVELLQRLGYQVCSADNADAAMALIDAGLQVDLLFTDVVMPGRMRSPELARLAQQRLPQLKVLFTSGYTQNAIVHGGRLDPGVHLLSKPYSREQLAVKVRALLAQSHKAPGPVSLRVAFVDDSEDFRMIGQELLTLLGHTVACFGDAEHALAHLAPGRFDVLMTDVGLPGMSGLELAQRARQLDQRLRIVIASGYGQLSAEAGALGARVLTKPFTIEQLEQTLAA